MTNAWIITGFAILALAGIWWYGRRVIQQRAARGETCPHCGQDQFQRAHRSLPEHLFGTGLKVRRYRCLNPDCGWEGLRRRANS